MGRCSLEFSAQQLSPGCISFGCRSSAFSLPFWVYALPGGGLRFFAWFGSPGALDVRHVQMDAFRFQSQLDDRSSQALVYPTTLDSEFGEGVQLDQLENWKPEVNISHWTPKSRGSWGWVKTYEIPIFWSINIKSFPAILGTLPYFT